MRLPLAVVLLLALPACSAEPAPLLANGGFATGLTGWTVRDTMCSLVPDPAAPANPCLKLVDTSDKAGSDTVSPRVKLTGPGAYELRAKAYPVSGSGLGIYLRRYDAAGKQLPVGDDPEQRGAPTAPVGRWTPFTFAFDADEQTAAVEIWIHSYAAAVVTAYLDDFEIVRLAETGPAGPPWPPQYKLKPTDKLTAADVVGPDGLVYPDWSRAGVPGGIPAVPVKRQARDFGAVPDDGKDDSAALNAACEAVGKQGGGAVQLEAGVYHLDGFVTVRQDGVVLRGAGRDRTRVVFRYAIGPAGIRWAAPAGDTLYSDSRVTFHADPTDLVGLDLFVADRRVANREWQQHWGNTFDLSASAQQVVAALVPGIATAELRAVARYKDGTKKELTRTLAVVRAKGEPGGDLQNTLAAIGFVGRTNAGPRHELAVDGQRGDTSLTLKEVGELKAGDRIILEGPATERWKKLTRNACQWGNYRFNHYRIARVDGNKLVLDQPLRIGFPVVDGSRVWRCEPIVRCGVEDLTIEQTEDLWITAIEFSTAWECWARGVKVVKCGRFPVYASQAKFCTVADCIFEDAWYKGGGGTAYAGWEMSFDCLMTDCTTYRLRHAPLFQWAASGDVIRRSQFYDSDLQWHSGWTNENLLEQCKVVMQGNNGGYGDAGWASPPEDDAHGPNGPRNVVYNCDLSGQKAGIWMGGMNEGWILAYNRIVAGGGSAIFAKTASFDHQIVGNVFVVKGNSPAVTLQTPDCVGIELVGNRVYGGSRTFVGGRGKPAVERANELLPMVPEPPLPTAGSIYEWEVARAAKGR